MGLGGIRVRCGEFRSQIWCRVKITLFYKASSVSIRSRVRHAPLLSHTPPPLVATS